MGKSYTRKKLETARSYIASPDSWLQWEMATGADGKPCEAWEDGACKFCAYGALVRATNGVKDAALMVGREVILHSEGDYGQSFLISGEEITEWNDDYVTTHKDVLAAFDSAIASCREREEWNEDSTKREHE